MSETTEITAQLDPQDQGLMVCIALNHLWAQSPACHPDESGCCPDCCGICDLIKRYDAAGTLDDLVRLAEPFQWENVAWWHDGQVNRHWLAESWSCQAHPPCETRLDDLLDLGDEP